MNKKLGFSLWGLLFAICAGFGFLATPGAAAKVLGHLFSLGFFALGGSLLWQARKARDRAAMALIRNLAFASLVATTCLLVANFLAVFGSEFLGNLLHTMLIIVSSPMLCAPSWAVSLFLWACLMVAAQNLLKKKNR